MERARRRIRTVTAREGVVLISGGTRDSTSDDAISPRLFPSRLCLPRWHTRRGIERRLPRFDRECPSIRRTVVGPNCLVSPTPAVSSRVRTPLPFFAVQVAEGKISGEPSAGCWNPSLWCRGPGRVSAAVCRPCRRTALRQMRARPLLGEISGRGAHAKSHRLEHARVADTCDRPTHV